MARSGIRVAQLAETFGVSEACIYNWLKQERIDRGEQPGLSTRRLGIYGLPKRRLPRGARVGKASSLDLVRRRFRANSPDRLWMTDITEHPTREGKIYCCAMVEAFWARMQVELLNRKRWKTRVELVSAIHDYIETWHNTRRRHSALNMLTPIEYESDHQHRQIVA